MLLTSKKEIKLVDAVDRSVGRERGPGDSRQRRVQVHNMDDVVGDLGSSHVAGPAQQERNAQRAFHCGVVRARPGPGSAAPRPPEFRPVVAPEKHDGAIGDCQRLDFFQDLADTVIHFGHRVREVARARLAFEVPMRQGRKMQLRKRHVGEEGPLGAHVPVHELVRSPRKLRVDPAAHFKVVGFYIARPIAHTALHHVRLFDYGGIESHRAGKHRLVGRARNTVPLIEAAVLREPAFPVSKVPFAVNGSGIAARG